MAKVETKGTMMKIPMHVNRRQFVGTALAVSAVIACKPTAPLSAEAKSRFGRDFLPDWQLSKEVTLEFARAMPDEHYNFKPTPDVRSFAEQMLHIAESNMVYTARFVKGEKPPISDFGVNKTKAEILALVEQAFDYVAAAAREITDEQADETVPFPEGERPRRKIFWYARDHATHHRGQTVTYFRLKGVVPPRYRA
ncbi:MAG: DinB family protein [Acidobacteria bacterium]|nr:DinB family protein [Acidobacteriota bacterium]